MASVRGCPRSWRLCSWRAAGVDRRLAIIFLETITDLRFRGAVNPIRLLSVEASLNSYVQTIVFDNSNKNARFWIIQFSLYSVRHSNKIFHTRLTTSLVPLNKFVSAIASTFVICLLYYILGFPLCEMRDSWSYSKGHNYARYYCYWHNK